jgi:hypothetical protein
LLVVAACGDPLGSQQRQGKELATADFLDPASAQWRKVVLNDRGRGPVFCGEVNGKNALGAYVGFQRVIVDLQTKKVVAEAEASALFASPHERAVAAYNGIIFDGDWLTRCQLKGAYSQRVSPGEEARLNQPPR